VSPRSVWKASGRLAGERAAIAAARQDRTFLPPAGPCPLGVARRQVARLQVLSIRRGPGRLKSLAGTGSGMGAWINDIVPEQAAQ
jgi:hypothetical protein